MKHFILLLFICPFVFSNTSCSTEDQRGMEEPSIYTQFAKLNASEGKLFLVLKGTKSKVSQLIQSFNGHHPLASHVAIGLVEEGEFTIYHVDVERSERGDNFFRESIDQFFTSKVNHLTYLGIWEVDLNSDQSVIDALAEIKGIEKELVRFDYQFKENENLYCSEFIVQVLESLKRESFQFTPRKKFLEDELHRMIVKSDTLEYYPVDFFLEMEKIKPVLEWTK